MPYGPDPYATTFGQSQYVANPPPNPLSPPSTPVYSTGQDFMGPGQNTTPFGYVPQYGVSDPNTWQEFAREYGLQQGLNAGQIATAPQLALNQSSRDTLAQQIAMQQASQSYQSGLLNQDYATGLVKSGLQGQSADIQRAALGRQPQLLSTLHDLANQSLNQDAATARRNLDSSATARGAFTSIGANAGRSDISNQLANQLSGSDTRYQEQVASLADQNKMLDLQGQNLGLDRQAMKTELERGLDRLGLSTAMSVADLTNKMNSSAIEDQVLAQQVFNAAIQSSDYYAQYYPGQQNPASTPPASKPVNTNPQPYRR